MRQRFINERELGIDLSAISTAVHFKVDTYIQMIRRDADLVNTMFSDIKLKVAEEVAEIVRGKK